MSNSKAIVQAFCNRKSVKIKYYSETTDGQTKERIIDVYGYNNTYFGGYCHLRNAIRIFRFDRTLEASQTDESYNIDTQQLKKLLVAGYISQQDTTKPPMKIKSSQSSKRKTGSRPIISHVLERTDVFQQMAKNPLARLINYYISCINEEDNKSLKLKLDGSKKNILINFIESEQLISTNKDSISISVLSKRLSEYFTPSLIDGKEGNIYYGYPIIVNPVGDITPLLYTEINIVKTNDGFKIVRQSQDVYLNQIFFSRELDLSDEEAKIAIDDIEAYFDEHHEFQERINFIIELLSYDKTFINPELLIPFEKSPSDSASIINQAIIYTGEVNPITNGLLNELNLLRTKSYCDNANNTCLRFLTDNSTEQSLSVTNNSTRIDPISILPSNNSQFSVLKAALSNSVTVITGPPGTGKSQIVVNMLANLALKGHSVLFASKNNKAVDVVLEKLSENLGSDSFIRTGSWEYRKQANEYLKSFNKSSFNYSEYEATKSAVSKANDDYLKASREHRRVQTIRDRVDQLQSVLDGTLPDNRKEDLNSLLQNYNICNISLKLIDKRVRLLKGKYHLWEKIFNYISTSYIRSKISKIDLLVKQHISNDLFDWIFADARFIDKISYIKIYVNAFRKLYSKRQEYDNCTSADILKAEVDRFYQNLLNASKNYVCNKIRHVRSTLSYNDVSSINEYAEALEKLVWRNAYKSIKDEMRYKIRLSYRTVLKAFPIWITTNLSADKSIPLLPGMYDYLIIDEASQCDIASALPLMYRARNVVILGDPFQLRHICTLTRSMDQYLAHRENVGNLWLQMSYRNKSLYDLAEHISGMINKPVYWLLEHYRCHRSIIGFSNDRFYQNKLIFHDKEYDKSDGIMTGIIWADVGFNDGTDKTNVDEVNYIKKQLKKYSHNELFNKLSVGVVTPFRRQANILNEQLKEFNVVVGTAHRYQGDEKDIIFFSTVINPSTADRTIRWINHTENLVNVAVSRARRGIVIVGSASQCVRLDGILKDLARYVKIEKVTRNTNYKDLLKAQSPAERALYYALVIRDVRPILQYPSVGYLIDIALIGAATRIAIEVDGEPYHNSPKQRSYDKERDKRLSQNGWLTMRFSAKDIYYSADTVANQIVSSFLM